MADQEVTTAAWLHRAAELGAGLPARSGLTGTVAVVVTGTGAGDVTVGLGWEDGRVVSAAAGAPAAPDLTLTVTATEGKQMLAGELEPSVAFMRGRLKTAGDPGLVIGVLGATQGAPWRQWVDAVSKDA